MFHSIPEPPDPDLSEEDEYDLDVWSDEEELFEEEDEDDYPVEDWDSDEDDWDSDPLED